MFQLKNFAIKLNKMCNLYIYKKGGDSMNEEKLRIINSLVDLLSIEVQREQNKKHPKIRWRFIALVIAISVFVYIKVDEH